jgi:integrase
MEKREINPPPLCDLIVWSRTLYEEALQLNGTQRRRVQVRDAVMFGILCEVGPRLRSLTEMQVSLNLQQRGQAWWIALEPENTKTVRSLRASLSAWIWPMITRYLTVERIELLQGHLHDSLWIDWSGEPLGEIGVAKRVRWRSEKKFDREFGPHMFRYSYATEDACAGTSGPFSPSTRLGHKDPATTIIYTGASAAEAVAVRHAKVMNELRRRTEGLAERTFPTSILDLEEY